MFVAERGVNTQFVCANVCMKDMKTFFRQEDMFFRQEDMKTCFLDKIFELCAKAHCELFCFELIGRIQPIQNSDWQGFNKNIHPQFGCAFRASLEKHNRKKQRKT